MRTVSRRGFLAAGGAGLGAAVLAACGTEEEEPSAGRDVELLGAALAAEVALAETYGFAAAASNASDAAALREFADNAGRRADGVTALLEKQGGSRDEVEPQPASGAESALEAAKLDLATAISRSREAAALLSEPEHRRVAYRLIAEQAAELAIVRDLLGEQPSPSAFVTGSETDPLVFPEPVEDDE